MTTAQKMVRVAVTNLTFRRRGSLWAGKCLLCNGPMAFDPQTGEGATLEHIRARSRGGTDDLGNLGLVHARCNHEQGRRWDSKRCRSAEDYEAFVARILERRLARLRVGTGGPT